MTESPKHDVPHWTIVLRDLWERAGSETFESVDVAEYAEENRYPLETVLKVIEVRPAWDYLECGVSKRLQWFHTKYDYSDYTMKTDGGQPTDEKQQNEQLSKETKKRINQLATEVESIPNLGLLTGGLLYSRHFNHRLPFEWVNALNEIVDESSTLRGRVVDQFLEQVEQREPTTEEKELADLLSANQIANEFYSGSGDITDGE